MRATLAIPLAAIILDGFSQSVPTCNPVIFAYVACKEMTTDPELIEHVLRPNDFRSRLWVQEEGCTTDPRPDMQVNFFDGFDGPMKVFLGDSLVFSGVVTTDHSTGLANYSFTISPSRSAEGKVLRVENEGHCMSIRLMGGWPYLNIHFTVGWNVHYYEYWVLPM